MTCKTCSHLLSLYEQSVKIYSEVANKIDGALGDDCVRAFEQAERFKLACQDASDRITEHWRKNHNNLANRTRT